MHICSCCSEEFRTRYLLYKHLSRSTVCNLYKVIGDYRVDIALKNELLQVLATHQSVDHNQELPSSHLSENDSTGTFQVRASKPGVSIMKLLDSKLPFSVQPSTLNLPERIIYPKHSESKSIMMLLDESRR